jgi:hypothetical protein
VRDAFAHKQMGAAHTECEATLVRADGTVAKGREAVRGLATRSTTLRRALARASSAKS